MIEIQNITEMDLVTYEPPYSFAAGEVKKVSKEHADLLLRNANFKEVTKPEKKVEKTETKSNKLTK